MIQRWLSLPLRYWRRFTVQTEMMRLELLNKQPLSPQWHRHQENDEWTRGQDGPNWKFPVKR